MEGRTHQFAFALFASVNIHLHGLDDSVIFGEGIRSWSCGEVRIGECWASTAKRGQSRSRSRLNHCSCATTVRRFQQNINPMRRAEYDEHSALFD